MVVEFAGSLLVTERGSIFVRTLPGAAAREPMLFVHGLGGESLDWARVVPLLDDRIGVYALDLPGFGLSPMPRDGRFSIDAQAAAVADVVDALHRGPVHLVGNSLGGTIATRVAADYPRRVRSLALISPALPDLWPRVATSRLLVTLLPVIGIPIMRRVLAADPEWIARQVFTTCYGDPESVSDAQWQAEVDAIRRRALLPYGPAAYHGALRGLVLAYFRIGRRGLWRAARRIDVPTALLYGGKDRLVDVRLIGRAWRAFPRSRAVLMPDAGHVAQLEFPERVARTLRAFLDEALPSGATADGSAGPPGSGNGRAPCDR